MNGTRATKNISLVLISSLLVFAGWQCGDSLREAADRQPAGGGGHAGGGGPRSGGGARVFWWQSTYYTGGGTARPAPVGGRGAGPSAVPTSSGRGGFGSSAHA